MVRPKHSTLIPFNRQPIERIGLPRTLDKLSSERATSSEWLRTDITMWTRPAPCSGALEGRIKRGDKEVSGSVMRRYFVHVIEMVMDGQRYTRMEN